MLLRPELDINKLEDTVVETKTEAARPKMPISQRAKQFMPFAALDGLEEAITQKEWEEEARQKQK